MSKLIDADKLLEWAKIREEHVRAADKRYVNNQLSERDKFAHYRFGYENFNSYVDMQQKINELAEDTPAQPEKDPWCYDINKASDKNILLVTDGKSYSLGYAYIDTDNNRRLMSYDHYTLYNEPIAWMLIPQTKGKNDE